jgi:hypothetical protein
MLASSRQGLTAEKGIFPFQLRSKGLILDFANGHIEGLTKENK